MNYRVRMEYYVRKAGVAGTLGVLLLLGAPAYYWSTISPLASHASALEIQHRKLLALKASGITETAAPDTREARLRAFHGFFPTQAEVPGWLSKIYAAAEQEKLPLPRGEYRRTMAHEGESPVALRISLPVKGRYDQIRRFLTTALAEVPVLALDEVQFQRQSATDPLVEAEIHFVLYVSAQ